MTKRGERRPYRIQFKWDNGIKGTETRANAHEALAFVHKLFDTVEKRGGSVEIKVTFRDTGATSTITERPALRV